tara:strand:- start:32 stop:214 length:183 start_codon:yes stop_codon:yes gene_type:complete
MTLQEQIDLLGWKGSIDLELVKEALDILIEDIENDLVDNSKTSQYRQRLLTKLKKLYKRL